MTIVTSNVPDVNPATAGPATAPETDFLLALRSFLNDWSKITKDEVTTASVVIREHYVLSRASTSGPCIACWEVMDYDGLSPIHKGKGDDWLFALGGKWASMGAPNPERLAFCVTKVTRSLDSPTSFRINGYSNNTVYPYLCANCWNTKVLAAVDAAVQASVAASDAYATEKRAKEDAILSGVVRATPAKRFWTLCGRMRGEHSAELNQMPYKDFLKTSYWQTVRGKVIYDRGGACELCNSQDSLNVHHRTYKYRGEEYKHLDTLVLLCQPCHAKFHDKLAKDEMKGEKND